MDVMGGKITALKNCTKREKEATYAHQKKARSALNTPQKKKTLELRQ